MTDFYSSLILQKTPEELLLELNNGIFALSSLKDRPERFFTHGVWASVPRDPEGVHHFYQKYLTSDGDPILFVSRLEPCNAKILARYLVRTEFRKLLTIDNFLLSFDFALWNTKGYCDWKDGLLSHDAKLSLVTRYSDYMKQPNNFLLYTRISSDSDKQDD